MDRRCNPLKGVGQKLNDKLKGSIWKDAEAAIDYAWLCVEREKAMAKYVCFRCHKLIDQGYEYREASGHIVHWKCIITKADHIDHVISEITLND